MSSLRETRLVARLFGSHVAPSDGSLRPHVPRPFEKSAKRMEWLLFLGPLSAERRPGKRPRPPLPSRRTLDSACIPKSSCHDAARVEPS